MSFHTFIVGITICCNHIYIENINKFHKWYYTSLARDKRLAVTVTRSCWGLWDTSTGRLLAQLAEAPLGAIVTHAKITPSGEYVVTAESGNILVWDLSEQKVCVHYSK